MRSDEGQQCSVFNATELSAIRGIPILMKAIIALLVGLIALIFIPFSITNSLSKDVGSLLATQEVHWKKATREYEFLVSKIETLEEKISLNKKFYWVDRNSREAREGVDRLTLLLEKSKASE